MKMRITILMFIAISIAYSSIKIPKTKWSDERCDWRKIDYDLSEYLIGTVVEIDTIALLEKYKNTIRYLKLHIDSVFEIIGSGSDKSILISQEISTINGGEIAFVFEKGKRYYFKIQPGESYYKGMLEYEKEILKARKIERNMMFVVKELEYVDGGKLIDYIKDGGAICKETHDPSSPILEDLE